jgi:hypothetical protein
MISPHCERAIEDALATGNALLKFISANDVDLTGGHQAGFYLPKSVWQMYSPFGPVKGKIDKHPVKITWEDGLVTDSMVTWYGDKSRNEYRLTRFGKDFPFRTFDNLGDMLVLVPATISEFRCYVLDTDEDMEEIQSALGVEVVEQWGAYQCGRETVPESPNECIERHFREFMKPLTDFPNTAAFSKETRQAVENCIKNFTTMSADKRLMSLIEAEYRLFRMVERLVCQKQIQTTFKDVDDFLKIAQSITNRRKSRAGRSLENHVSYLLNSAGVKFDARARIDGKVEPDILIPGKIAYEDGSFPADKLRIIGVKTTCKDRWRQVLNEGKRVQHKHILTLQPGISANQLKEMHEADITLIVPEALHKEYPKDTGIKLLTVSEFIKETTEICATSGTGGLFGRV